MRGENTDNEFWSDQDNNIEFVKGSKTATCTFSQQRYVGKIRKLAAEHPNEVEIVAENENSIVAHIPVNYVKISPPRQMSDEQRQAAGERLNAARKESEVKK